MVHTERRVQQNNHTGLGYGGKSKLQPLTLLFKPQVKEKTLNSGTRKRLFSRNVPENVEGHSGSVVSNGQQNSAKK